MDIYLTNIRRELKKVLFSEERIQGVLDFIEFLQEKEIDLESRELSEDPEIMKALEESEREYQAREYVDFNDIRKENNNRRSL